MTDPYEGWADVYDVWTTAMDDVPMYTDFARAAGSPVVELGAGSGRVTVPIAQADIDVIAIDASPTMIVAGRRRAAYCLVSDKITWVEGDMRSFKLDEPVRLVIIPARAFLHLMTTEDQLNALDCIREALVPGGRLVMNFFVPRPEVMVERDGKRLRRGTVVGLDGRSHELDEVVTYDATTQRVLVRGIVQVHEGERHVETRELQTELRWIGRYEMEHLFTRTGFEVQALYGWFDRRPFDERSTEMIWVARKP